MPNTKKSKAEIEYDNNVKCFLSQKIILAYILANTVEEFKEMNPKDIVKYIEDYPVVSRTQVDAEGQMLEDFVSGNETDKIIAGLNTEDSIPNEGVIYYDIKFVVYAPGSNETQLIKIIVDVEAQNQFNPGYDIVTRGFFYCSRMISSQKEREFVHSDYDKIKKVYSIWICIHSPRYAQNTITRFEIMQKNMVGIYPPDRSRYDLMTVVLVCLSDELADRSDDMKLHRLLGAFFSKKLSEKQKKQILEEEYDIQFRDEKEIERSVSVMCNVSQGVLEEGIAKGIAKGRAEYRRAYKLLKHGGCTSVRELVDAGIDLETALDAYQDFSEDF